MEEEINAGEVYTKLGCILLVGRVIAVVISVITALILISTVSFML